MKVTPLTLLMLEVNHLIDTGKYTDISIADVHSAIEQKRLLKFLKEKAGDDIDLSIYFKSDVYGDFEAYYEEKMNIIYGACAGQERRKWGVENSGLCLVIAWTNEIIQQGEGLHW